MKLWYFYVMAGSGEKFELRDENENIIVIPAETSEEATETIKKMYCDDYFYELKNFLPASELERIPTKGCWVIWYIDDAGKYCYSNEI